MADGPLRWVVLGPGSLGSAFTGLLTLAGEDVTLVGRRQVYVDAISERGLVLRSPDGAERIVHPAVTATADDVETADVVLVLTKTYSNREAAAAIEHAVHPGTWVITPQNGLGNDRTLAEVLPRSQVVPGTTTVGAVLEEPGVVELTPGTVSGDTATTLGPPAGVETIPDSLEDVAARLTQAGLPTEIRPDAALVTWTQLATAAPMNPLAAILRHRVSTLIEDPDAAALARSAFDEVVRVANAAGVPLERDEAWARAQRAWAAAGAHTPSMLRDVLSGNQTEIGSQCLEVVRLAEENGLDTPVLRTLGALVSACQRGYDDIVAS